MTCSDHIDKPLKPVADGGPAVVAIGAFEGTANVSDTGGAGISSGFENGSRAETHQSQMANWLNLLIESGRVTELRALDVVDRPGQRPCTYSGFFDHLHLPDMVQEAMRLSQTAKGVYFTINPVNPDLLARRNNRVAVANNDLATDVDVTRRHWLLLDLDPQRIAGVSSSDGEKAKAQEVANAVQDFLTKLGWPLPLLADSGNGYHLLYRIDLPVDDDGLVKRVLQSLANRFDSDAVNVDKTVFNPSRITKLYGTLARKGDNTTQRPHRWSKILSVPASLQMVSQEQLAALTAERGDPEAKAGGDPAINVDETVIVADATERQQRAREILKKVPTAVSGNHGHDRTFHAACLLVKGVGLSPEQALAPFKEWNETCQPPWSESELRHKLEDAAKQPGPRGHLLNRGSGNPGRRAFSPKLIDSASFDAMEIKLRWLVEKMFVSGQPMILGGPKKTLKTSLVLALAISLGSGQSFLGEFKVPSIAHVLVLSGESGTGTLRDTARRICRFHNVNFAELPISWCFDLPQLSNDDDLHALVNAIVESAAEVVFIDPLYLCLLAGNSEAQPSNLYQIGPLLLKVASACLSVGATPVLVHHTRKESAAFRTNRPLDLDDLAFAGIQEFARQWMLISRSSPFDPSTGEHRLWLQIGGSAGHCGLYGVEIAEGVMNNNFGGRYWQVLVVPADTVRREAKERKEKEKQIAKTEEDKAKDTKIIEHLRKWPSGQSTSAIAASVGLARTKVGSLLAGLQADAVVCRCKVSTLFGKNSKEVEGWKLYRDPAKAHRKRPDIEQLIVAGMSIEEAEATVAAKAVAPTSTVSPQEIPADQPVVVKAQPAAADAEPESGDAKEAKEMEAAQEQAATADNEEPPSTQNDLDEVGWAVIP